MDNRLSIGLGNVYDSLAIDSPVAHSRNVSRFSRLVDRSRSFFLNSPGASQDESQSNISMNQSNLSDIVRSSQISPIVSNKSLNISSNIHVPPSDNINDGITEDEMSRLVIFESFFELNQKYQHESDSNIFLMMEQFEHTCEDNLLVTKRLLENKTQSEYQLSYLNKFSHLLLFERNIWCLLKVLLNDRFANINNQQRMIDMEIEEDMRLRLSDSELISRAMERNSTLREMQIIIDWLESVYEDENGSMVKMDFYSDGPGYWENTLHNLKVSTSQQHIIAFGRSSSSVFSKSNRNLCTEMDPDAPIRNGQSLHDLDKEDENRLFHNLFKLIRSGKLPEGKAIAERFGYFWLSAALDGWILYHDPNYNEPQINNQDQNDQDSLLSPPDSHMSVATQYSTAVKQLSPVEGNPYRDLWKHSAWKCSKMEGTNLYERAIFAVFSGNRSVLMPLCTKWMDKLWAYFKCSLDVHLENLLMDTNISKPDMQPRINIELPDSYWDNRLTPEEIFRELEIQFNLQTSTYISRLEEECYRAIVKDVILADTDSLIDHLYEWSKTIQTKRECRTKPSNEPRSSWNKLRDNEEELMAKIIEPNLLRLFAHLVICAKELNLIDMEKHSDLCVEILEIYIGFLIEYKLVELIAFYTGFLPEIKQVRTFATLLETIEDESDRRLCLIIAKNAKLNLPAILSLVVENLRLNKTGYQSIVSKMIPYANFGNLASGGATRGDPKNRIGILATTVTEDDIRKINALDWLLLDGDNPQYLELLWQANGLIRNFMLEQKIDQAFETNGKLPSDIINRAYQEWKNSDYLDHGFEIENVVHEYLCHTAYFEASEAFKKWHQFLYNTKPREPIKPKTPITRIADRVAYEQRLKQYEQDMEIWKSQIEVQAINTTEKLLKFLRFPGGIWMDLENPNLIQEIDEERNVMETDSKIEPEESNPDSQSILSTEIVLVPKNVIEENEIPGHRTMSLGRSETLRESLVIKQHLERKRLEWQQQRPGQLDGLRRIYVPQFVFLLQSVYRDSGDLKECVKVADLLANENQKLYSTFTQEQLADFLAKTREVCIEILHYTSDPFGCDIDHHHH